MDENNPTKSEAETEEVRTTPLLNINNQTTSKTETIDFPDLCPQSQKGGSHLREIQLPGLDPIKVAYCSYDDIGSGWWLVYRKLNRSRIFNRPYEDYERGFGNLELNFFDEFFIGLNRLHRLTREKPHELVLYAGSGTRRFDHFVVGDRSEGYKVKSIGNCTGDDVWMSPKQGSKFSTFDRYEDGVPGRNLAEEWGYGWWFEPSMRSIGNENHFIDMYIRKTD
ncbi:fibrinogen-like protein 1 [Drosophila bipectinata]|uniref:fibrinogen-like protein 1 n=1 Tax=Drosophila bipectinata TaxID=42026 RepID=UPI0038B30571